MKASYYGWRSVSFGIYNAKAPHTLNDRLSVYIGQRSSGNLTPTEPGSELNTSDPVHTVDQREQRHRLHMVVPTSPSSSDRCLTILVGRWPHPISSTIHPNDLSTHVTIRLFRPDGPNDRYVYGIRHERSGKLTISVWFFLRHC